MNKIIWICGFLTVIHSSYLSAQYYEYQRHPAALDTEIMKTNLLYRHKNGFLWIGTDKGLVRYDGDMSDLFYRENTANQKVTSLHYVDQVLWVGYEDGGIEIFKNEKLTKVLPGYRISSRITGIAGMDDGVKVVSTYGSGIFLINLEGEIQNFRMEEGILSNEIYCIQKTGLQNITLGTDHGLQDLYITSKGIDCQIPQQYNKLEKEIFLSLAWNDQEQTLAGGTFENGVFTIQQKTGLVKHIFKNLTVNSVSSGNNSVFYFNAVNNGSVHCYDIKADKLNDHAIGAEKEIVPGIIFYDDTDILWILSPRQGLISIDTRFYIADNSVKDVQSLAVCGDIVFWGDGKKLQIKNKMYSKPESKFGGTNIWSLDVDCAHGILYCGTFGSGILIYDFKKNKVEKFSESNGLLNNNVLSVVINGNELWAATLGGITVKYLNTGEIKYFTKKDGLVTGYNYSLFTDSAGNIRIGSDGYGLLNINKEGEISSLPSRHSIISIAESKYGDIWYSTNSEGLFRLKKNSQTPEKLNSGLKAVNITGVINDNFGNIYAFHSNNIDIIHTATGHILSYGQSQSFRQINAHLHALAKDETGNLWFSDEKRIIRFTTVKELKGPELIVKYLGTNETDVKRDDKGIIRFRSNDLQVDYTAIWFDNPSALKFRYKIEGLVDEWVNTRDKKLIFPNLRPGQYKFILQCDIQEGFFQPAIFEQVFIILTPFYKTNWFLIFCVLLLAGVSIGFFRLREKRKRHIQQLTTERIKSELDMIKSQIDPHFLFNSFNTLISAIETDKHAALQFAERMSDFYRTILEYRGKDRISLDEELRICSDYVYLLQARFGSNLSIEENIIDPENYSIIPLTLQIVIENVVKHNIVSVQYPLIIDLFREGHILVVRNPVRLRRDKSPSTHFGLDALMKRYQEYTGKAMTSGLTGEFFEVRIPLQKID